jgi:hypothetical protein
MRMGLRSLEMVYGSREGGKGMVEGLVEALTAKQTQLDVHLNSLAVDLGDSWITLRFSGDLRMTIQIRDLAPEGQTGLGAGRAASVQS